MWVTVAISSSASTSCAASTVTVCVELQSLEENVRLAGSAVTSVLSDGSLMVTVTATVGWLSSTIVYVPELPSPMVSAASETETPAPSSSSMLTVVVAVVPALTPVGSGVSKASSTLSPSSSMESGVAMNVIVFDCSFAVKVTLVGTEKSVRAAPCLVATRRMTTVRSGTALSFTVTVTVSPSGTV